MEEKNRTQKIIRKIWFFVKLIIISIFILPFAIFDAFINLIRALNRIIMVVVGFGTRYIDKTIYLSFVSRLFKV